MSKLKTGSKSGTEKVAQNGTPSVAKTSNGNNGAGKSAADTLRDLNKTYTTARTKKEKDEARKALTMATFNATHESHQKRRS